MRSFTLAQASPHSSPSALEIARLSSNCDRPSANSPRARYMCAEFIRYIRMACPSPERRANASAWSYQRSAASSSGGSLDLTGLVEESRDRPIVARTQRRLTALADDRPQSLGVLGVAETDLPLLHERVRQRARIGSPAPELDRRSRSFAIRWSSPRRVEVAETLWASSAMYGPADLRPPFLCA